MALTSGNGLLSVFVDGVDAGSAAVMPADILGPIAIGAPLGTPLQQPATGQAEVSPAPSPDAAAEPAQDVQPDAAAAGDLPAQDSQAGTFLGLLDEVRIANVARDPAWIALAYRSQGAEAALLIYGEDEAQESAGGHGSHFGIILQKLTLDGWVVIAMLAVMAVISWVVMLSKGIVVGRTRKANGEFLQRFKLLGTDEIEALDRAEAPDEQGNAGQQAASPFMVALFSKHDHFQGSTTYRVYHTGLQEIHRRVGVAAGAQAAGLSSQAMTAVRAAMETVLLRETQKLNGQMVLLTIAISGGPFIGLLGTVVGVMITFAAIAQTGDVNINNIAPGMAAALLATVAGLAVAIPALFGYNYLGSRIKEISADTHVFLEEFLAKTAEQYSV